MFALHVSLYEFILRTSYRCKDAIRRLSLPLDSLSLEIRLPRVVETSGVLRLLRQPFIVLPDLDSSLRYGLSCASVGRWNPAPEF